MKLLAFLGIMLPVSMLLAAVVGLITFDMAVSAIQWTLTVSPILLIIDNYREKRGQNFTSMAALGSGLTSIGLMFLIMGLGFTALATASNGALWIVLAVQAVIYMRPTEASNTPKVLEK